MSKGNWNNYKVEMTLNANDPTLVWSVTVTRKIKDGEITIWKNEFYGVSHTASEALAVTLARVGAEDVL